MSKGARTRTIERSDRDACRARVRAGGLATLALLIASLVAAPARGGEAATEALEAVEQGHAAARAGRTKDACRAFDRAATLLPTWWIGRYERARCGRTLGESYEALLEHASAATRHAPANAVVWQLLGFVHEDAGFPLRATEAYRRALSLDSTLPEAQLRLARLELAAGRPAAARDGFAAVRKRWPERIEPLWGLYEAGLATGDHAEAERALLALAERTRYPARVYALLVRLYRDLGLERAEAAATRAWKAEARGQRVPPLRPHVRSG